MKIGYKYKPQGQTLNRNLEIKRKYIEIKRTMKQFDAFEKLSIEYNLSITTIMNIVNNTKLIGATV